MFSLWVHILGLSVLRVPSKTCNQRKLPPKANLRGLGGGLAEYHQVTRRVYCLW